MFRRRSPGFASIVSFPAPLLGELVDRGLRQLLRALEGVAHDVLLVAGFGFGSRVAVGRQALGFCPFLHLVRIGDVDAVGDRVVLLADPIERAVLIDQPREVERLVGPDLAVAGGTAAGRPFAALRHRQRVAVGLARLAAKVRVRGQLHLVEAGGGGGARRPFAGDDVEVDLGSVGGGPWRQPALDRGFDFGGGGAAREARELDVDLDGDRRLRRLPGRVDRHRVFVEAALGGQLDGAELRRVGERDPLARSSSAPVPAGRARCSAVRSLPRSRCWQGRRAPKGQRQG